jgi:hypothetical protein
MMSRHGFFYLSKDSGNTWAFTDFTVKAGIGGESSFGDFGMTPTGSAFSVIISVPTPSTASFAWASHDGGTTWNASAPPTANTYQAVVTNIASDGLGIVIGYQSPGFPDAATTGFCDVSTSGGLTWTAVNFHLLTLADDAGGNFTASHIFPSTTPPPPSPPSPSPSLYMRYSNDGGHTWSNYRPKGLF